MAKKLIVTITVPDDWSMDNLIYRLKHDYPLGIEVNKS